MGTPRIQDFVEALREQSEWIWAPGEGAARPDLAADLTGAQTSMYARARVAVEAAPRSPSMITLRRIT